MKNLKSLLCLMLVICIILTMVACADSKDESSDSKSETNSSENSEIKAGSDSSEDDSIATFAQPAPPESDADVTEEITEEVIDTPVPVGYDAEYIACRFVEGAFTGNYELTSSTLHSGMVDEIMADFSELIDVMASVNAQLVSYEIVDSVDKASEIAYYENELYSEYDLSVSIETLQYISVYVELSTSQGPLENTANVYVAKIDGDWYVIEVV